MPSTIETGHAKNVANFQDLLSLINGLGAAYNPSKVSLQLPALTALHTQATSDLASVASLSVAYNNAVNVRSALFQSLRPLATRIISALKATDASTELIKDAVTINRKIQGKRAQAITTPTDPNAPAPLTISVSQVSQDQLTEHLFKLIELLKSEPSYNPNETELSITELSTYQQQLKTESLNVSNAYTAVANARIARDKTMYKPKTGLVDKALEAKSYIKSVFGSSSPQYKQIAKVNFKNF